ncbi:Protein png1 [Hypoxylon texense]
MRSLPPDLGSAMLHFNLKMFTFVIPCRGWRFRVHRSPFQRFSPVFADMMKGRDEATITNCAVGIFDRVVQFIYSGTYREPTLEYPFRYKEEDDDEEDEEVEDEPQVSLAAGCGRGADGEEVKEPLAYAFLDKYITKGRKAFGLRSKEYPTVAYPDVTTTFEVHESVYAAGREYRIPRLPEMALYRLADALAYCETSVAAFDAALWSLCSSLWGGDSNSDADADADVREMVAMFVACRRETYRGYPYGFMRSFFDSTPAFAADVQRQVDALKDYEPSEKAIRDHHVRALYEEDSSEEAD